ncbi:OmpA family protein [Rhodoferax sp.]|uniref:OmpA family protein n=1 Tax=Rhodoferax sp. TaxID=50421 RepID=UPI002731213D|nr:OmpA family protein [Rhodoferax sp.]MDP1528700.1 OmpA family protein [Rhodoferax sp.]MDP1943815.1 OmpA family protein [Rhodoferax sp.]MDP2441883.1 OmpA family protein [Rhodoferax sp.]MDZ4208101.1 OmpA family protein [Rhodoferax sp.]
MTNLKFRGRPALAALSAALILLTGCANMSDAQRSSAIGAGVGALAGAAIGDSSKSAVIGAGVGALGGYIWSTQMAQKKAAMEQATAGTGVDVTQTADNQLKLNIPSDISFDVNSTVIKPNLRPILDQFAQGLANQPNTEIRIVGHTDSTGSDAINNPLSVNRASSARNYLISRGVNGQRIQIDGRGSYEPVADNYTEAGRAKNRRIEMFLAERAR